jgi:hypothetical protein
MPGRRDLFRHYPAQGSCKALPSGRDGSDGFQRYPAQGKLDPHPSIPLDGFQPPLARFVWLSARVAFSFAASALARVCGLASTWISPSSEKRCEEPLSEHEIPNGMFAA